MSDQNTQPPAKSGFNKAVLIPPIIFLALGALFFFGLNRENADELNSAFIGRPAPDMPLTQLGSTMPPDSDILVGNGVQLVNFWASWCGPCRVEHPNLMALQEAGVPIIGANYKDAPNDAIGFLEELGNPYEQMGADTTGRIAINWGVYGVPETFVIDNQGQVVLRHPGPITGSILREKIIPAIEGAAD